MSKKKKDEKRRTSESTDHDHTSTETLRGKVAPPDLRRDLTNRLALVRLLAHLRDQRIRGMRDDGTDDTSEVTRRERNTQLRRFRVAALRLGEDVLVEQVDNVFEEEELGHRVRDLAGPKREERTEGESGLGFHEVHLRERGTEGDGERSGGGGLDADFGHFEGAEGDIGEDFGRGGTGEPDRALVFLRVFFAGEVHVEVLEDFVETVLEHSLEGVADEGGAEALPETS